MEFENMSNHTHEEVIEQEEVQQENDNTETQVPDTTQDEYDIIKYNKEEVKIPVSERQNYLQKGYHFDTVKSRADELEQNLSRLAQISGFNDTTEFIKAIEEAEQQQRVQQEAQKLGINEDAYRQHIEPVSNELNSLRNELKQIKQQESVRAIENEVNSLKSKYPDFEQHQDRVFDLAIEKGFNLEDAYKIATYEDRINTVSKQTEQEVLARITGRDNKQVLASNDQPSNATFDPDNMSFEDIQKISERVRRGERIVF